MEFINKLIRWSSILYVRIFLKKRFAHIGKKVSIIQPLKIKGIENMYLSDDVLINYRTWLEAQPLTAGGECRLEIGKGSVIGNYNHIYATRRITIGNHVLIADKVYISDNLHSYGDIHVPIMHQPVKQLKEVHIGNGSWLGEHVCILGAKIGRNCVIGANAVVTRDIPDYCVATGVPARIIKRYCFSTLQWERTNAEGEFLDQG